MEPMEAFAYFYAFVATLSYGGFTILFVLWWEAKHEIARLKRGEFTPEEFQNLCHHRDESPGCTRADFEIGCREYQEKLFGKTA